MRRLRAFGHPLHPALTDFPLALLPAALVFDAVGRVASPAFWSVGSGCLLAGMVMALPAVATGMAEVISVPPEDEGLWTTATSHLCAALSALGLFLASLLSRPWMAAPRADRQLSVLGLELAGTCVLLLAGWLGGHLVFRHGVGVDPRRRSG